jgi:LuxR family maltose regulon positive regulatory protein
MSRVAEAAGNGGEAIRYLDQAERLYQRGFVPDVRPIRAMKARIWVNHGQLSLASGWASDAAVSVTDDVRFLSEFDLLTLVRLLLARYRQRPVDGGLTPVTELLARMLLAAASAGRAGSVLEIRTLQALASHAQGHRQEAGESLQQALTEAPEPDGYGRLFTDEGAPMTELLRDCDHAGLAGVQTQRLLLLGQSTHAHLSRPTQPSLAFATSLSGRELQVLRLLSGDLTGPQIADELFLSHNTVRTHTKHIFRKLDVTTRRAAVRRAREGGLL